MEATKYKNGKINEKNYEGFVEKQKMVFIKKYNYPEDEARKAAEDICGMYKHHFREMVPVK